MSSSKVYSTVSPNGLLCLRHGESDEVLATMRLVKAKPEHRSFILSTWVKSYAPTMRRFRAGVLDSASFGVSGADYLSGESAVAEANWEDSLVAVDLDDDFVIHAWVCGSPGALLHCYVPPQLRQKGIAMAMIKEQCGEPVRYSKPWPFRKVPPGWSYNPYLLQQARR